MLYLIKSICVVDKDKGLGLDNLRLVLKIGYTNDINSGVRFTAYSTHNKAFEILDKIPGGSLELETALHRKFREYRIESEWFEYKEEIIDFFKDNHDESSLVKALNDPELNLKKIKGEIIKSINSLDPEFSLFIRKKLPKKSCNLLSRGFINEVYVSGVLINTGSIKAYVLEKYNLKEEEYLEYKLSLEKDPSSIEVLNEFNSYGQFTDKMKVLCKHPEILGAVHDDYSNYYYALGPDRIKACEYKKCLLEEELEKIYSVQNNINSLRDMMFSSFNIGQVYSKSYIKNKIATIYESLGIKSTPNSLTIKDYFEVKDVMRTNKETGKRDNGFEILKKKGE